MQQLVVSQIVLNINALLCSRIILSLPSFGFLQNGLRGLIVYSCYFSHHWLYLSAFLGRTEDKVVTFVFYRLIKQPSDTHSGIEPNLIICFQDLFPGLGNRKLV